MATPIRASASRNRSISSSPFGTSFSGSPIAQESLARDIEECSDSEDEADDDDDDDDDGESSEASTVRPSAPRSNSIGPTLYRRQSSITFGGMRPAFTPQFNEVTYLTKKEKRQSRDEERSLLRDNHLAPPKHPRPKKRGMLSKLYKRLFSTKAKRPIDEEGFEPSEVTALLPDGVESHRAHQERLDKQWEEAIKAGKIKTTWQREAKTLWRYSSSLVVTFLLQYSFTVASIFTVGHLGTVELGAVSLASMTANITGYAVYQGLATSLDTLCAQAYGSGKKHLVGLQLQRMVYFLWVLTIPIGIFWIFAEKILQLIIPEQRSAELAGLYLRILIIGAPGFAAFESGKRFVQAQGLFSATTYVLLFAAPLNAFMNWLFVWKFEWGFIGAPIAVVITDNLLPLLLFLYVRFVDGRQCWNGFTKRAFHNWGPMIRLALPGLLMVEAEFLAFELLVLASSHFSTTHLAAQSILATISAITFQLPFSISIAASTRVANLIGATLSDAAKSTARVTFVAACIVGLFNIILLSSLRNYVPQLFTNDQDVINLVANVLPVCAANQLFDAWAASSNGLLRGLGRQEIGGWVNLFCYYAVALPISFGTGFGLHWELQGLWSGVAIALGLVAAIEGCFLYRTNWEQAVEAAKDRNAAN